MFSHDKLLHGGVYPPCRNGDKSFEDGMWPPVRLGNIIPVAHANLSPNGIHHGIAYTVDLQSVKLQRRRVQIPASAPPSLCPQRVDERTASESLG